MRDKIFESYVNDLKIQYSKFARDVEYGSDREKLSNEYYTIMYAVFHLYRNILTSLDLDQMGKDDCFREPTKEELKEYKCSLNTKNNEFPLVRILEYRHRKFPEYLDDYGMETFLEFKDSCGDIKYIRTNDADWDYVLDKTFDVDIVNNLEPQKVVDLLYSDTWFEV